MVKTDMLERFSRQIQLPEIGEKGQEKIHAARVFLIGAGGLASSAAYYLAAAGIGTIGIGDDDKVETSNLNRQILHNFSRIGMMKVASAKKTLKDFNPSICIIPYPERLSDPDGLSAIISHYDIVIDCSDNYSTRFAINEACIHEDKPWVYGAVSGFEGQVMTIVPGSGPCYRCLYPSAPPYQHQHDPSGVVGVSPGIIGIIQATEVLKYVLQKGHLLTGRLLFVDLLEMNIMEFKVPRNPECKSCKNM